MNLFPSQTRIESNLTHLIQVHLNSKGAIRPHCFLTGPTGSGKSFLVQKVCEQLKARVFEVNAAQLTAEGISGNSLSKALRPLKEIWDKPNVIFVDEFDKLFQRNGESTEGFRNQVQDEFLHVLESKYASVFGEYGKYDQIIVENSLFIFGGAFHGLEITTAEELQAAGMRPEFIGRVPLVLSTNPVSMEELRAALPHMDLFKEYLKIFPTRNQNKTIDAIMKIVEDQHDRIGTGIRILNMAMHQHFMQMK